MIDFATASGDACVGGRVGRLQPRPATGPRSFRKVTGRRSFLHLSGALTLGTFLVVGPVHASMVPPPPDLLLLDAYEVANAIDAALPQPIEFSQAQVEAQSEFSFPPIDVVAAAPVAIDVSTEVHVMLPEPVTADLSSITPTLVETAAVTDAEIAPASVPSLRDSVEVLDFDGMRVPRWVVETILRASDVTGVDPVYMMALADKESSFLPENKATTSSAEGLFQFVVGTWLEVVRTFGAKHGLLDEAAAIQLVNGQLSVPDEAMREHILGLRRNSYLSALMAAEMMKRDRVRIERRIGRRMGRSEFYLAHFFGVDSASKFMNLLDGKPRQSAPRFFPAAARANKALFFAKKGRKTRHLTVAEVFDKIDEMIDRRLDRYEDVTAIATLEASL